MEKLVKHQKIVEKILKKQLGFPTAYYPHLNDVLVINEDREHFMVVTFGWDNQQEHVNEIKFHLEINKKGKVIIHENITDIEILDLLIEHKIAEKDILDGLELTFPSNNVNSKAA